MRFFILLTLLLLPVIAQAQATDHCLSEQREDNRVSGRVAYAKFPHPTLPNVTIAGYKLILLKPACYDFISPETNSLTRDPDVTEIQFLPIVHSQFADTKSLFFRKVKEEDQWVELREYLKDKIGKLVTVTGPMQTNASAYYVAVPQILVGSLSLCELAPQSKNIKKC